MGRMCGQSRLVDSQNNDISTIFLMLGYPLCFYLPLQNLSDSGMISLLKLHPKTQFTYLPAYFLTYLLTPWSKVVP